MLHIKKLLTHLKTVFYVKNMCLKKDYLRCQSKKKKW